MVFSNHHHKHLDNLITTTANWHSIIVIIMVSRIVVKLNVVSVHIVEVFLCFDETFSRSFVFKAPSVIVVLNYISKSTHTHLKPMKKEKVRVRETLQKVISIWKHII